MVELVGIEPTTSSLRTMASAKLSLMPFDLARLLKTPFIGWFPILHRLKSRFDKPACTLQVAWDVRRHCLLTNGSCILRATGLMKRLRILPSRIAPRVLPLRRRLASLVAPGEGSRAARLRC